MKGSLTIAFPSQTQGLRARSPMPFLESIVLLPPESCFRKAQDGLVFQKAPAGASPLSP